MLNASVRRLFVASALVLSLGAIAQAKNIIWGPWELKDKPPLSLTQALPLAQAALGNDANSLWCSSAVVAKIGLPPQHGTIQHGAIIGKAIITGEWVFTFNNGKGERFTVTVLPDQKVHVQKPSDPRLTY